MGAEDRSFFPPRLCTQSLGSPSLLMLPCWWALASRGCLAGPAALVEVRPRRNGQVVMICRRDPLVLDICSRICGWMELP